MAKINKEKEYLLSQELLMELLRYEYETGLFYWLVPRANNKTKVGDVAGYVNKSDGYVHIGINDYAYQAHRLVWLYVYGYFPHGDERFIDHINGNPSDNRVENLKKSSHSENCKNKKMMSNNTSGINSVRAQQIKQLSGKVDDYWVAYWYESSGKQRSAWFSVEKLGEDEAKLAAIKYRAEQLRLLEQNHGIVYSDRHGT